MSKRTLSLRDLREIHTTVHECLELRDDPLLWRRHFLRRMRDSLGTRIGIHTQVPVVPAEGNDRYGAVEVGWGVRGDRDHFMAYVREGLLDQDPLGRDMSPRLRVLRREENVDDDQWYQSPIVMDYYRAARVDHAMTAQQIVERGGARQITTLMRAWGDQPFSITDRRKFALAWATLKRYLDAGQLSEFGAPRPSSLPPRTRAVLVALLQGDSVKQVAIRLRMSPHTVHDHVKRLHRDLNVQSRGELVSRYARLAEYLADEGFESGVSLPSQNGPHPHFHVFEH